MPAVSVQQAFDLAVQHHQAGRLAEAEGLYRQILAVDPRNADVLNLLGVLTAQADQSDAALDLIAKAIALRPNFPEAFYNLGKIQSENGRISEAIAAYRQAIALRPSFPEACSNLGNLLRESGQLPEAIVAFGQAMTYQPNLPEVHYNLGITLKDQGQIDEAIAAFRRAIALRQDYPEAYVNLGNTLQIQGRLDEAIAAYRRAIALKASFAEAYAGLGNALQNKGQLDEAVAAFRHAIALKPEFPKAHTNLAIALLLQGDFLGGWEEYEWRWKLKEAAFPLRDFAQPQWDGGPLEGRTLLLHTEQGFGDAIQFVRFLPLLAQSGGRIIIECQPELRELFRRMAPDVSVLAKGQTLPAFDFHCPLLSLGRLFSIDPRKSRQTVPYLHAEISDAATWRARLLEPGSSPKVGLVWAGRPTHNNDRNRSLKLATLAPFAEVPGVRFYSLQKGNAAAEVKTSPMRLELMDVADELNDFADTAALIANLDLVISVDTAVAHLAGAMGKPIWTLLPFAADWRWLLDRSDSPWYPTMRLFRQRTLGDWDSLIQHVAEELKALVESRRSQF